MKKKLFSLPLALLMVFSMVSTTFVAYAQSDAVVAYIGTKGTTTAEMFVGESLTLSSDISGASEIIGDYGNLYQWAFTDVDGLNEVNIESANEYEYTFTPIEAGTYYLICIYNDNHSNVLTVEAFEPASFSLNDGDLVLSTDSDGNNCYTKNGNLVSYKGSLNVTNIGQVNASIIIESGAHSLNFQGLNMTKDITISGNAGETTFNFSGENTLNSRRIIQINSAPLNLNGDIVGDASLIAENISCGGRSTVNIHSLVVFGDVANGVGGGRTVTLTASTINGNVANGGDNAGVGAAGGGGTVTLEEESTINGNVANGGDGGGGLNGGNGGKIIVYSDIEYDFFDVESTSLKYVRGGDGGFGGNGGFVILGNNKKQGYSGYSKSSPTTGSAEIDVTLPDGITGIVTVAFSGKGVQSGYTTVATDLPEETLTAIVKAANIDKSEIVFARDIKVVNDQSLQVKIGEAQLAIQGFTGLEGVPMTLVHQRSDGSFEYLYDAANSQGTVGFGPIYELSPFILVLGTVTPPTPTPTVAPTAAPTPTVAPTAAPTPTVAPSTNPTTGGTARLAPISLFAMLVCSIGAIMVIKKKK